MNHSLHFKDPDTGAHTNAIESSWRAAKSTMSSAGRVKSHIPGNLARYMFFKSCNEQKVERTEAFLKLAGKLYDAKSPREVFCNEVPEEDDDDVVI